MQLRIDTLEAQLAALTGDAPPAATGAAAEQTPCPPPPLEANSWESLVGTAMSVSSASTESTSPDLRAHHAGALPPLNSSFGGSSSSGRGRTGPPAPGAMIASGSSGSSKGRPVMNGNGGGASGELLRSVLSDRRSSLNNPAAATNEDDPEMDKFRGGLALNAHGELRYYVGCDFGYDGRQKWRKGLTDLSARRVQRPVTAPCLSRPPRTASTIPSRPPRSPSCPLQLSKPSALTPSRELRSQLPRRAIPSTRPVRPTCPRT